MEKLGLASICNNAFKMLIPTPGSRRRGSAQRHEHRGGRGAAPLPIVKKSGAPCQRSAHGRRSRLGTVTRSSTPGARTPETPPRRKQQRTTTLTTSRQTAHTQASKTQPHSTRAQHHTPRRPRRNCRVDHRPPNPSSRSTRCAQDLRRQGAPQARECSDSSSREGHRPQNPLNALR